MRTAPTAAASTSGATRSGTPSPATEELGLWPDDYVLTAGPATAGFTGVPAEAPDIDQSVAATALAECLGVPPGDVRNEFDSASQGITFVNGSDRLVTIGSGAAVVSEEQVSRDRALLDNPRFAECSGKVETQVADDYFEGQLDYELASVEALPPPGGADSHLRMTWRISSGGRMVEMSADVLRFLVGRVEVAVTFTYAREAPSQERLQQIADQIAGKLRNQRPRSLEGRPREGGPAVHALGPLDG
ncbi:hypothetical protein CC117_09570 [Parafrankia colletiae]|uniref:PknH-like extracellular domain-containing protein n=1 Tax=Parafrankia colletiae TaxID=573497 RepID=A0A1S1RFR4_9ACTN|nr:hypothetical protein CC117_09570 [Parafrankia colletiae]